MKGLILKDLYYIRNNFKMILVFLLFFGIMFIRGNTILMGIGMITIILGNICIGTISADDKDNWDKYALTMPISRKDLIVEKFVFVNSFIISAFLLVSIVAIVLYKIFSLEFIISLILLLSILMIIINLEIFITYKYGGEKTTIYIFGIFGSIAFIGFILGKFFPDLLEKIIIFVDSVNLSLLGISALGIAIICITLFFTLTFKIIKNREY